MSDIVWEDPPQQRSRLKIDVRPTIAELRKQPGKWALVLEVDSRATMNNHRSRFTSRGCEASSRTRPDGTFALYARWPEDES